MPSMISNGDPGTREVQTSYTETTSYERRTTGCEQRCNVISLRLIDGSYGIRCNLGIFPRDLPGLIKSTFYKDSLYYIVESYVRKIVFTLEMLFRSHRIESHSIQV